MLNLSNRSFSLARADRVSDSDVRTTWLIEVRVQGAEKPALIASCIAQLRYRGKARGGTP